MRFRQIPYTMNYELIFGAAKVYGYAAYVYNSEKSWKNQLSVLKQYFSF